RIGLPHFGGRDDPEVFDPRLLQADSPRWSGPRLRRAERRAPLPRDLRFPREPREVPPPHRRVDRRRPGAPRRARQADRGGARRAVPPLREAVLPPAGWREDHGALPRPEGPPPPPG